MIRIYLRSEVQTGKDKAIGFQQKIASLRSELDRCKDSAAHRKNEMDKWKRRAKTLWAYMPNNCFIALVRAWPEATNWFEEEKDDGAD